MDQLEKFSISNTAITPEIRLYLSRKGYGRGFYLAPFYRYSSFSLGGVSTEINDGTEATKIISLSRKLTAHSGGLLMGAQWPIGKYICLDWWILGPHYGISKGQLTRTSSVALLESEQTELKNELNDLNIPLVQKNVTVNANSANVKLTGPFAGIRSGISLGVKF